MVITESIPFLRLQKHKAVLPASTSPLSITDFSTLGRGGKALGQMGAELPCWWASVSVLAVLTAHPSWWQVLWIHNSVQQLPCCRQLRQQPCIPAPARGDEWAQWPWCCLLVRTCPMAMAWLELSERELGISQLCVGLFQQKLCSVKPFDHVSLAHFSQRKWWNFCKKHFSVGVHSAPTNFSSKVCSKKRGRIQSYLC